MKQLALFDLDDEQPQSAPAAPRPAEAAPPVVTSLAPAQAPTPHGPHQSAPWVHARGNRHILLDGVRIAYHLRRGRRRTIGFVVGMEGLVVSAPRWVLVTEIERAVVEKSRWIVARLHEAQARCEREQALRMHWGDGAQLPFLGEPLTVVLDPREPAATARIVRPGGSAALAPSLAGIATALLHVGLPHDADAQRIRDCVQAWLMREAKAWFAARLDHFAPRLGVRWTRLSLSNAGTRWGTAHADGHIRLNWRLIHLAPATIDYVVAHELAHLQVMDHSPRFWDTVARVVPDYGARRAALRDETVPRWD